MLIFAIACTYYSAYYAILEREILIYNLNRLASYVASEITDLVSLSLQKKEDGLLIKRIRVPSDINGRIYNLTILEFQGKYLAIQAYIVSEPSISSRVSLPWPKDGFIRMFNGSAINGILSEVNPTITISSISKNPVIWSLRDSQSITFGLGIMKV
ncbi:MAG TPA: hypothetical protein ENF42_00360 [Candidatus Bathyarchaeota archaeon]|nr:hypothetical protein [Candidatus Bathyarchaeota archaeon]